jgi:hypothetical protein
MHIEYELEGLANGVYNSIHVHTTNYDTLKISKADSQPTKQDPTRVSNIYYYIIHID